MFYGGYYGYRFHEDNYETNAEILAHTNRFIVAAAKVEEANVEADSLEKIEPQRAEQIKRAQTLLSKLGYQVAEDGKFTSGTRKAIELFEQDRGLIVVGNIDSIPIDNLNQAIIEKEDNAWSQAKRSNTQKSYQSYLSEYAEGRYATQAQRAIAELKESTRLATAKLEDAAAYERASKTNTIASYHTYLNNEKGQYRNQAQQAIERLQLKNSKIPLTDAMATTSIETPVSNTAETVTNEVISTSWALQLGVFRHRKNVAEILNILQDNDISGFAQPVNTSSGELFRVYVGPDVNRVRLEVLIPKIRRLTNLQSRLMEFKSTENPLDNRVFNNVNLKQDVETVIQIDQLPENVKEKIPSLSFSAHMYAADPNDRWIRVNGKMLKENDDLNGLIHLVSIAPNHVIFQMDGYLFKLPSLKDWK